MSNEMSAKMTEIGQRARLAAVELATADSAIKTLALEEAAKAVRANSQMILAENRRDLELGRARGLSAAMLDRLHLDDARLEGIVSSLRAIAAQEDPVGQVLAEWDRPNGLHIERVAAPIGVIGVIYESRPNVTADAGALCLKSGNAVILRGGSESFHSSQAIHACLIQGLRQAGLSEDSIQLIETRDRRMVSEMLRATDWIDVIVPRGGKGLVTLVQSEARVPVFAHLDGICHVYVDKAADLEKACRVVLNAKTRRAGICGAAECLLIDRDFYARHGDVLIRGLQAAGVEVRGEGELAALDGVKQAKPDDFGHEFLDMIMAAKIVDGVGGAIAHIRRYGSQHTDSIITEDDAAADRFFAGIDSAIIMRNASTQFADGGEFGMGAEIGIATGKLHARGPVGAAQLCSFRYRVTGDGAVRA